MLSKKGFSITKEQFLGLVMLITVIGSLILAIIDVQSRPHFIDLTKFAVGTYVGLLIPRAGTDNTRRLGYGQVKRDGINKAIMK